MPTTYKVLGQVTGTAPTTASTTVNLVTDPSFEGISFSSIQSNPSFSDNSYKVVPANAGFGTTNWKLGANDSSITRWTNSTVQSVTPATNFGSMAFGFYHTNAGYNAQMCLGKLTNSLYSANGNGEMDTSTAIPVSPSTTYNVGFSFYRNSGAVQSFEFRIQQWTAGNTFSSQNTFSQGNNNWTSSQGVNSWYRFTNTITTDSAVAYITIEIRVTGNTSNQWHLIDGVTLTTNSTYNSTFISPNDATAVAPFTNRFNPFYSGTPYFSPSIYTYPGTQNTLYTVPSSTQAVVSTISVTNLGISAATQRIAVKPSGQTLATKHWITFDAPIGANSTEALTLGLTLNAGDAIIVQTDSSLVSFSAFGSEIS